MANYVRFILPGKNNFVQVNAITSPLEHAGGNFWYGDYIDPAKYVKGRWFLQKSGAKGHCRGPSSSIRPMRTPTRPTSTSGTPTTPRKARSTGTRPTAGRPSARSSPIAPPNGPTTFHVELAVVDNDKDNRQVWSR